MIHQSQYVLRSIVTVFAALLLAGGGAGCDSGGSNGNSEKTPTAQVRFMHASADAGSITVTANGRRILSDLSFSQDLLDPTVTKYQDVAPEGTIEVQDGEGTALATVDATEMEAEQKYMVVVAGSVAAAEESRQDAPQAFLLRDNLPELGSDEVGLRVIHGSLRLPSVDVFFYAPDDSARDGTRRASGVSFSETWPDSPAGTFQVESIPDDGRVLEVPTSEGPLDLGIETGGASFSTGRHITAVAIDRAPDAEFPWAATVQVD